MKKVIAVVFAVAILSSFWYLRSRTEAHNAQAQRDEAYQSRLQFFQRDLRLGTHRSEVQAYLEGKKVPYISMNSNFAVKIGEDPSREWYCDRWIVYIEFRFSRLSGQMDPSPFDNLDSISMLRIGQCL